MISSLNPREILFKSQGLESLIEDLENLDKTVRMREFKEESCEFALESYLKTSLQKIESEFFNFSWSESSYNYVTADKVNLVHF